METRTNEAGQRTEIIMAAWLHRLSKRGLSKPDTGTYNAAYEAVYSELAREQERP